MTTRIRDYSRLLTEAIAESRAAGVGAVVDDLEQVASAVFTTSSEMLQEHGLAIRRFLVATDRTLSRSTKRKLQVCLNETELACTGWRKLIAQLRRPRVLD
jgi:hypothetical protein